MNSLQQALTRKRLPLFLGVMVLAPCCALAQGAKVGEFTLTPERVAVPRAVSLSATAGLVLRQVVAGKTTLQAAWEQKLLGRDDVIGLLSRPQLNGVPQERQGEVRIGLAKLLAGTLAQGEEGLKETAEWPSPVRLSLADYYRSVRDERAVPLYQELIQELDAQVKKSGPSSENLIDPVANLAYFYAETGKPRKAIQIWEKAGRYSRSPEWRADVALMMGRVYTQAGELEKAKASYDQVPQHGQAWYSGLAIYDQAYQLIEQGKHSEARALLQQPLSGARADEVKVALLSLLSASYLSTGEIKMAHQAAQASLDLYASLPKVHRSEAYLSQLRRVKEILDRRQ